MPFSCSEHSRLLPLHAAHCEQYTVINCTSAWGDKIDVNPGSLAGMRDGSETGAGLTYTRGIAVPCECHACGRRKRRCHAKQVPSNKGATHRSSEGRGEE